MGVWLLNYVSAVMGQRDEDDPRMVCQRVADFQIDQPVGYSHTRIGPL